MSLGVITMQVAHKEPVIGNAACELRIGVASWDDGSGRSHSLKFTWFDKLGRAARGGEIPVEALGQALDFAIRTGYIRLQTEAKTS